MNEVDLDSIGVYPAIDAQGTSCHKLHKMLSQSRESREPFLACRAGWDPGHIHRRNTFQHVHATPLIRTDVNSASSAAASK